VRNAMRTMILDIGCCATRLRAATSNSKIDGLTQAGTPHGGQLYSMEVDKMKNKAQSAAGDSNRNTGAAKATEPRIVSLSAVTLATCDMPRAVRFYEALGFPCKYGGASEAFTSFALGGTFLNLIADPRGPAGWWGRVIVHVSDVDGMYRRALAAGIAPEFAPLDAPWGERYFHVFDPDGHEISFAKPLA
jgi:catechol 2,3-dioxygenase-like lactoylglutathione lyase family enzyme